MGDSVVWGDGNKLDTKFSAKVAQQLADGTGRNVQLVTYAHSGARLLRVDDPASVVPVVDGATQPDLNSQAPSTMDQEACAAVMDKDAEILIVDGCINEVNANKIALPFPFNWTTPKDIQESVNVGCSQPMRSLLDRAKMDFSTATVVVLNYYQIVTSDAHLYTESVNGVKKETVHKGTPPEAVQELEQERQRLLAENPEVQPQAVQQQNFALGLPSWQANSKMFLDATTGCFQWAVAGVNGQAVPPLGKDPGCPAVTLPKPARATQGVRFFLVVLENKPEYGYGASDTHEWRLIPVAALPPVKVDDNMYDERAPLCDKAYPSEQGAKNTCRINAIAHPNVKGAWAYADAISEVLKTAWGPAN